MIIILLYIITSTYEIQWGNVCKEMKINLLHPVKLEALAHLPFHLGGGGPKPLSSKLGDCTKIPARRDTL